MWEEALFTPEGKIAIAFLLMYTGLSAPKLMEQLNGNIHYQIFCGIFINPKEPMTNPKLINKVMSELAGLMKIQVLQTTLARAWKPYMKNLNTMYTDTTCYESRMRFPTDAKLLWECIGKSYVTMCRMSRLIDSYRPRTKYLDVSRTNMTYVKQRKHSQKQTQKLICRQLDLLGKILKEIRRMQREHPDMVMMREQEGADLTTITKIYRQQANHFRSNDVRESIPDRIVSISKPYIRPIVRGKEIKSVEFGAKSNNI